MADKLIKNPDEQSAYQVIPESMLPPEQKQQQVQTLPTFTESELEAKFAEDNNPGNLQGETVSEFAAGKAAANGTATPTSGQPTGETPVTTPAADATGVVAGTTPDAGANTVEAKPVEMKGDGIDPVTGEPFATTPDTGNQEATTTPTVNYLTDWSKVDNVYEEAKRLNLPLAQVLADYQKWGENTGNPTSWMNAMLQDKDLSKTAEENEKAAKRAANKEKWDKVGNFLLHLGNAIGNVAGGGYGSLKLEDPVQWTERQRLIKEKNEQQRKLNNQSIWSMMQKERAEQRAAEVQRNALARQQRQDELAQKRLENDSKKMDAYIQALQQKTADNTRMVDANIEYKQKAGNAAETRANKAGKGGGRRGTTKQDSHTVSVKTKNGDTTTTVTDRTYGNAQQANQPNNQSKYDKYKRNNR